MSATQREAKDALYDAFALVSRALGSGRRIEIVDLLAQGERSVEDVATEIDQSIANTSHHLRHLATSGLLVSRREGQRVFYGLASDDVGDLWASIRDVAVSHVETLASLADEYLGERREIDQLTADQLAARLERGNLVVIDVRPASEWASGHIAGARSSPLTELDALVDQLPRSKEIVAYCRGPYCRYADDAVRLLREHGFRARRLDVGYPEWRRAGLPVDTLVRR